jgi:DNA-binding MarR family transcriptional regulator
MPDLQVLFHELVRFQIELWNAVDARLRADHDMPLGWYESMQVISVHPSCRVNDIADELVITVGGISKIVDRLETAGLCQRRPNPDDRRSSIIELTGSGRRLLAKAADTMEDELESRLGTAVSARSLQQFGSTLEKLRAAGRQTTKRESGTDD